MKSIEIWSTKECVPCKQLKAHLDGKVDGNKVNIKYVENETEEASSKGITSVPATLFIDSGVIKKNETGYSRAVVDKIIDWLR